MLSVSTLYIYRASHFLIRRMIGFFFVVQNSQRRSIRAMFTGETAMSAVRRPSAHRDYIRQVAKQTVILRLQGSFATFIL